MIGKPIGSSDEPGVVIGRAIGGSSDEPGARLDTRRTKKNLVVGSILGEFQDRWQDNKVVF